MGARPVCGVVFTKRAAPRSVTVLLHRWWKRWNAYARYCEPSEAATDSAPGSECPEEPGEIINEPLLVKGSAAAGLNRELKEILVEGEDFTVISRAAWDILFKE